MPPQQCYRKWKNLGPCRGRPKFMGSSWNIRKFNSHSRYWTFKKTHDPPPVCGQLNFYEENSCYGMNVSGLPYYMDPNCENFCDKQEIFERHSHNCGTSYVNNWSVRGDKDIQNCHDVNNNIQSDVFKTSVQISSCTEEKHCDNKQGQLTLENNITEGADHWNYPECFRNVKLESHYYLQEKGNCSVVVCDQSAESSFPKLNAGEIFSLMPVSNTYKSMGHANVNQLLSDQDKTVTMQLKNSSLNSSSNLNPMGEYLLSETDLSNSLQPKLDSLSSSVSVQNHHHFDADEEMDLIDVGPKLTANHLNSCADGTVWKLNEYKERVIVSEILNPDIKICNSCLQMFTIQSSCSGPLKISEDYSDFHFDRKRPCSIFFSLQEKLCGNLSTKAKLSLGMSQKSLELCMSSLVSKNMRSFCFLPLCFHRLCSWQLVVWTMRAIINFDILSVKNMRQDSCHDIVVSNKSFLDRSNKQKDIGLSESSIDLYVVMAISNENGQSASKFNDNLFRTELLWVDSDQKIDSHLDVESLCEHAVFEMDPEWFDLSSFAKEQWSVVCVKCAKRKNNFNLSFTKVHDGLQYREFHVKKRSQPGIKVNYKIKYFLCLSTNDKSSVLLVKGENCFENVGQEPIHVSLHKLSIPGYPFHESSRVCCSSSTQVINYIENAKALVAPNATFFCSVLSLSNDGIVTSMSKRSHPLQGMSINSDVFYACREKRNIWSSCFTSKLAMQYDCGVQMDGTREVHDCYHKDVSKTASGTSLNTSFPKQVFNWKQSLTKQLYPKNVLNSIFKICFNSGDNESQHLTQGENINNSGKLEEYNSINGLLHQLFSTDKLYIALYQLGSASTRLKQHLLSRGDRYSIACTMLKDFLGTDILPDRRIILKQISSEGWPQILSQGKLLLIRGNYSSENLSVNLQLSLAEAGAADSCNLDSRGYCGSQLKNGVLNFHTTVLLMCEETKVNDSLVVSEIEKTKYCTNESKLTSSSGEKQDYSGERNIAKDRTNNHNTVSLMKVMCLPQVKESKERKSKFSSSQLHFLANNDMQFRCEGVTKDDDKCHFNKCLSVAEYLGRNCQQAMQSKNHISEREQLHYKFPNELTSGKSCKSQSIINSKKNLKDRFASRICKHCRLCPEMHRRNGKCFKNAYANTGLNFQKPSKTRVLHEGIRTYVDPDCFVGLASTSMTREDEDALERVVAEKDVFVYSPKKHGAQDPRHRKRKHLNHRLSTADLPSRFPKFCLSEKNSFFLKSNVELHTQLSQGTGNIAGGASFKQGFTFPGLIISNREESFSQNSQSSPTECQQRNLLSNQPNKRLLYASPRNVCPSVLSTSLSRKRTQSMTNLDKMCKQKCFKYLAQADFN